MYSLQEILGMFDLTYDITNEDLKRVKKIVMMTHPDKSGLSSDYFLFYKKAFDIVLDFCVQQLKEAREVPKEQLVYAPMNAGGLNKAAAKKVSSVVSEMEAQAFQSKFNQLFEDNMARKIDESRNSWFKNEQTALKLEGEVTKQNMNQMFEQVKTVQAKNVLAQYRGVQELGGSSGTSFYDDGEEALDDYVTCDPFSKLKFDDLRKVHKDQTVLAVGEQDFTKVKQYGSVDQFMTERGKQDLTPLDNMKAEMMLKEKEDAYRREMMKKQYNSTLQTMEYEKKNKTILGNFMRIGN
jgi:outer membrane murein-binding lipoprotein Lpp